MSSKSQLRLGDTYEFPVVYSLGGDLSCGSGHGYYVGKHADVPMFVEIRSDKTLLHYTKYTTTEVTNVNALEEPKLVKLIAHIHSPTFQHSPDLSEIVLNVNY